MWLAWRHGACLVPAPRELVRAGVELGDWFPARRITAVSTVPTLAALWTAEQLATVRLLILGGEACPEPLAARLASCCEQVWNTYGPTETTVVATATRLRAGTEVRIGRPLPGYEIAVVDPAGHPVAAGELGELVIAGAGLGSLPRPRPGRRRLPPAARPGLGPGLLQRRPGPRRPPRADLPRPPRRPDQDPRVPGRARRSRTGPARPTRRRGRRRHRQHRARRRPRTRRLLHHQPGTRHRRRPGQRCARAGAAAGPAGRVAARAAGPRRTAPPGQHADADQREDRPVRSATAPQQRYRDRHPRDRADEPRPMLRPRRRVGTEVDATTVLAGGVEAAGERACGSCRAARAGVGRGAGPGPRPGVGAAGGAPVR